MLAEHRWRANWKAIAKWYRWRSRAQSHAIQENLARIEALETEIQRLRDWKESAIYLLSEWDDVWGALGRPGKLGDSKAEASLAAIRALLEHSAGQSASDRVRCPESPAGSAGDGRDSG